MSTLATAVTFLLGFWLGGAFLTFAITWTQDRAERSLRVAVGMTIFALLWPFTIMGEL